ncbi:hypothetical protein ACIGXM_25535 [Kitasatospora sp. NPDC052896]|uniref:hypothetical protein n=1 Tax=Kitasatospora sp. NPDC052896 TaxID=3364061 RepID=UPI0037C8CC3F
MLPVHLTLLRDRNRDQAPTESEAIAVQDTVWAHAAPDTGLEHVRARAIPGGIGLVVYVRAHNSTAAQKQARRLLLDVLASTSCAVHGYSLVKK